MLRWLFLDMNSYFASVEQHDRPDLRGKPVGVVPVDSDHTILIAASYEAKAQGAPMGTHVRDARQACPNIAIIKARPARYVDVHHQLKAATDKHIPIHTTYSIDEWSARLLRDECRPNVATALAKRIKKQIAADLSPALRCSIGIAPTRLLAKTACELQKPDGLTVLDGDQLPEALRHLALRDIPGIGGGIETRLLRHGVRDVDALWNLTRRDARQIWGSVQGEHFWLGLHGIDAPEIKTHRHSMSHAHILPPKLRSDDDALAILIRLVCKLGTRMREQGYRASRLSVFVKYESKQTWGDGRGFPPCADTPTLIHCLNELWSRRSPQGDAPKHVSITAGGLTTAANTPLPLFADEDRPLRLSHAIDHINLRHGSHTIYFAAMHPVRDYDMDDKIAFGRIPDTRIPM